MGEGRNRLRERFLRLAFPALVLSLGFLAASPQRASAEELGTVEPPLETWEDELFGGEEPLYHDSAPSWAEEDPGLDGSEGYAPLFPPLAPWDLDEPGLEEPTFAERDLVDAT